MPFGALIIALSLSAAAVLRLESAAAPSTGRGVLVDGQPLSEVLCMQLVGCGDEQTAASSECERFEQQWRSRTHHLETARSRVLIWASPPPLPPPPPPLRRLPCALPVPVPNVLREPLSDDRYSLSMHCRWTDPLHSALAPCVARSLPVAVALCRWRSSGRWRVCSSRHSASRNFPSSCYSAPVAAAVLTTRRPTARQTTTSPSRTSCAFAHAEARATDRWRCVQEPSRGRVPLAPSPPPAPTPIHSLNSASPRTACAFSHCAHSVCACVSCLLFSY